MLQKPGAKMEILVKSKWRDLMGDRIAYVPWWRATGVANEYLAKVQSWNDDAADTHHQHDYDLVFSGDPNEKAIIRALPYGHRIYIKGHGLPGDHKIYPNPNPGTAGMKYDDVCDNLIGSGLQKRWAGVIVCDNCYSAVPAPGRQAFAAKVSQYMRGKGYLLISFIGYFGPVDSLYNDRGGKYSHRHVTLFGKEVKSKWAQWRF
jgi:hypothetical protein